MRKEPMFLLKSERAWGWDWQLDLQLKAGASSNNWHWHIRGVWKSGDQVWTNPSPEFSRVSMSVSYPRGQPRFRVSLAALHSIYIQGYLINDVIITCARIPNNSKRIVDLYPNTNTSPVTIGSTQNSTMPTEEQGLCFTPKGKQLCTWPRELWDHEVLLYRDKSVSPGTSDNHFSCHFWGNTSKGLVARRGLECC